MTYFYWVHVLNNPFLKRKKTNHILKNLSSLYSSQVDNLARGLLSLGLQRGDRLAIWSPNTYECYVTQLAAWKAGLILVLGTLYYLLIIFITKIGFLI